MNKTTKDGKKGRSSNEIKTLAEVEQAIDTILEKHKVRIEVLQAKKMDVEKFSMKNRTGKRIYYVRKNTKKKDDDSESSEILSEKIITDAKTNLGEKPEKKKKADLQELEEIIKPKKHKKFGFEKDDDLAEIIEKKVDNLNTKSKQEKKHKKETEAPILENTLLEMDVKEEKSPEKRGFFKKKKSDDLIDEDEKKDIDFVTSSTDDLAGMKKKKSKDPFLEEEIDPITELEKGEVDLLNEKIKDASVIEKLGVKEIVGEEKALKFAKKHIEAKPSSAAKESLVFDNDKRIKDKDEMGVTSKRRSFFKKKTSIDNQSKKIGKESDSTLKESEFQDDDLSEADPTDIDDSRLLDEKIGKTSLTEANTEERKEVAVENEDPFTEKKFFFKKKPSSESFEKVAKEEKVIDYEEQVFKPRFHVENLPAGGGDESEAVLLEEKIKNNDVSDDFESSDEVNKVAEEKALKLAKEHIKEKSLFPPKKSAFTEKEKRDTNDGITGSTLQIEKSKHEHVFFDEGDASFSGWSPRLSDEEKKKMSVPLSGHPEIANEDFISGKDVELPKEVLNTKSVKLSDLGFSENEWEELDFYTLHDPFAFVEILREKESLDKCYFLVEIELSEEEERILGFIQETMSKVTIDTMELESTGDDQYLLSRLNQVIEEYDIKISDESREKIFYYIGKDSLGLGKIDPLMRDPNIEDISCDGAGISLFLYHRQFGSLKSNINFNTEDELSSFVFKLAQRSGKHISIAEPMLDATMPDGSRIQMTLSDEITAKGSTFTIRKFREDPFSPPDLIEFNTMSSEMVAYMWIAVENGINTLFAGGTASGKTTALNALSLFIPRESKIVSIEETRELNLPHPNWIPGVARSGFGEVVANKMVGEIDMYDLMKAALRQRPEYILVGEIRGREAYVLFQAMATGHATYSTVHADSAQSLIHRLEGKPINIPRVMLQSLDIVCLHVITRVKEKRARRCKQIIEIIDIDPTTKEILTNEVFRWDPVEDKFVYSGKSYVLERIRAEKEDINREEMTEEIRRRKNIIEWMNTTNVRAFREVANLIARYGEDPAETYKLIMKDVKK